MRQLVDLWSPSNFPWTNPEVLRAAREEAGMNFANGAANLVDDVRREALGDLKDLLKEKMITEDD